jgi:ATP synthase protein I
MNKPRPNFADETEVEQAPIAWTAAEVEAWRRQNPSLSPWRVVGWQVLAGLLIAALAWVFTGKLAAAQSALYGAAAVFIPGAVLARGLTSKLNSLQIGVAVTGFFVWEVVKIAVCVAMLLAAPKILSQPHWPALLVGMVLTIKVYWLALIVPVRKKF